MKNKYKIFSIIIFALVLVISVGMLFLPRAVVSDAEGAHITSVVYYGYSGESTAIVDYDSNALMQYLSSLIEQRTSLFDVKRTHPMEELAYSITVSTQNGWKEIFIGKTNYTCSQNGIPYAILHSEQMEKTLDSMLQ